MGPTGENEYDLYSKLKPGTLTPPGIFESELGFDWLDTVYILGNYSDWQRKADMLPFKNKVDAKSPDLTGLHM